MKSRFLFFHQNCFVCLYYLFGGVFSSFSEQWDRWRRKFWGKTQKNCLLFWKKDFSALYILFSSPRLCFVFFVILILSFLDDVSSLFSNVTIHSSNAKDKIPQPLYLESHLKWNSLSSLGSFLTVKQFLLQSFLFSYIHTSVQKTSLS